MSEITNNSKKSNSLKTIARLRDEGVNPYPDKFLKKINIGEISTIVILTETKIQQTQLILN